MKRAVYHLLKRDLRPFVKKKLSVQRTIGPFFILDIYAARKKLGLPRKAVVDQALWSGLVKANAVFAFETDLMNRYIDEHKPAPPPPVLVEPNQGFNSLDRRLWPLYSQGRNMGLSDLGTYNPASRLPSGRASDHSVYPAVAFDLGFSPQNGYGNPIARAFFHRCASHPEVSYVILGNKIWSVGRGLHDYYSGGHQNHVHVSGHRR